MRHWEDNFDGPAGERIFCQCWQPETPARALVLVVHGAGEHSGRYLGLATKFIERGYAVAAFDHPNHGRSGGRYGHVDRFDEFVDCLGVFHRRLVADFPGLPVFLLGHSMGGLISCHYLLEHQSGFTGCVLSGAAIKTDIQPGRLQMLLISFLSTVTPTLGVLQLDANGVSRNQDEVANYVNDPLVNHGKMTARKVSELFRAMNHIQQHAHEITLPMLLLHGEADAMASAEGSRFLHENIGSSDKTLRIYPGLYHEIFNEPEQEQVYADALDWCELKLETG